MACRFVTLCYPCCIRRARADECALRIQSIAVTLFGINGLLQLSSTMFQRLAKKRQLNSLVLFINLVPFITNLGSITNTFPEFKSFDGKPMEYLHVFQWMFTTPCMILILSSLGTSMCKQIVFSWPVTLKAIFWDELMLVLGLLSYIVPQPFNWVMFCLSGGCFVKTMLHIHGIVLYAVNNSGTTFEAKSILILEVCIPKWMRFHSVLSKRYLPTFLCTKVSELLV